MAIEIKVPVLPESVSDAVIATWHKKVGDAVKRDENIVDLETDKVVLEVPSTVDGVIKELKFAEGATVLSQQVIAIIEEGAAAAPTAPAEGAVGGASAPSSTAAAPAAPIAAEAAPTKATTELPPGARFTAATSGVNPADVAGTGRRGAVTKEDIVNFASGKTAGVGGGARPEERVPMTRMRTRIAERLMQSKNSIAMLTSFNEVNLAKVMQMRKELGEQFEKANGIKLGFMSFFAKAAANALQRHPIVNPPQSAILGMHAIKERAIVENGVVIAAPMMYIALSYDHRIIDGKDAVLFLVDIKNQLENPSRMLLGM